MTQPQRMAAMASALLLALAACTARPHDGTTSEHVEPGARPTPTAAPTRPTAIEWTPYDQAFERARNQNKPVVLVFTAAWCGQCRTYQSVLSHPEVVALSQELVMVRVDIDQRPDVNARYQDDGGYVPRTLFFRADGTPLHELRAAHRSRYVHFLDTGNPDELLSLMRRALAG